MAGRAGRSDAARALLDQSSRHGNTSLGRYELQELGLLSSNRLQIGGAREDPASVHFAEYLQRCWRWLTISFLPHSALRSGCRASFVRHGYPRPSGRTWRRAWSRSPSFWPARGAAMTPGDRDFACECSTAHGGPIDRHEMWTQSIVDEAARVECDHDQQHDGVADRVRPASPVPAPSTSSFNGVLLGVIAWPAPWPA